MMEAFVSYVLSAMCFIAMALEARCIKQERIPDNDLSIAGRHIKIVGYLILWLRFAQLAWESATIPPVSALAVLCIVFSDIVRCANRLNLPESALGREHRA